MNSCRHSFNGATQRISLTTGFGGRLVMHLGGPKDDQYIYLIDKDLKGNISYTKGLSVR